MNWQELERINKEYLDTLDLSEFIVPQRYLSDIMYDIERVYDDDPNMPEELQGCVFNVLDEYEFGIYLAARYGMKLREEYISHYYLSK